MKSEASATVIVARDRLVIDFGERVIIAGPCSMHDPVEARFAADVTGPGWEKPLRAAHLGEQLTAFLEDLALIPGAKTIKAYLTWVEFVASADTHAGYPAKVLLTHHYGITPAVTWLGGRPLHSDPRAPSTHLGV